MKYSTLKYIYGTIPVMLILLTAGSIPYMFLRKFYLLFLLAYVAFLFIFSKVTKKDFILFLKLTTGAFFFLAINYLFAEREQSFQKLFANSVIFLSSIIAAIFYVKKCPKGDFMEKVYSCLKIVLFHALLAFLLSFIVTPFLTKMNNWHYECSTFLNLFYYLPDTHTVQLLGINFVRNQGLFWEPGVLQIFLNFLLFLEIFVVKKSRFIMIMTILCLITTFSTTGLFIMMIQLFFYAKKVLIKNVLFFPILMLFLAFLYTVTKENINDKVYGSGFNSFQVRLFDFVQPISIANANFFTGVGLDDQQFINVRNSVKYSVNLDVVGFQNLEKGSSNSIMFFLAAAGYPALILIFIMLYNQQFIHKNKNWFFIFIVISLMTEPLLLRPFFMIFVFSGGVKLLEKYRWKIS